MFIVTDAETAGK